MRLLPATTFGRLLLLLTSLLLALLFLIALAFRAFGLGSGAETYADLIAGNVQLVASGATTMPPMVRAQLDFRRAAQPPANARPPRLPFQRHIAERLQMYFGADTRVLFTGRPDSRVWVGTENDKGPWIGVRVPDLIEQTVGVTARLLFFGLLTSVALAYWFARNLTVPLQRLAAQAPALSRGQFPESPPSGQGPREIVALESALRAAALEVQQSARDREMLLAGVSHDLRTPLARLRVALELQSDIPRVERDALHADIDEMDAIINQFLDYVRDGRDESVQKLDLAKLIDTDIAGAARTGVAWQRQGLASLVCDFRPLSLRRALGNLMRNAELHGLPPFQLSLSKSERDEVEIIVTDAGTGVPADWLPKAGQPFSRVDEARGGKPGAGLGLSLASRVMQMHGGRLLLRNLPTGGFEAKLAWPRNQSP
jgi:two-component system osmolarity sensor histidine kinase EnvZ